MECRDYYGPLWRPHRKSNQRCQQQSEPIVDDDLSSLPSDSVISSVSDESTSDDSKWDWPNQQHLRRQFQNVDVKDPSKLSWESLYDHSVHNQQATKEWYPGYDIVEALLFAFYKTKKLNITEAILQNVIYLLISLQQHGVIDESYALPYSAKTIMRMTKFTPKVPMCMLFCILC